MDYSSVRSLHLACAAISIVLFCVRAALALAHLPWRQWRWLRILPHVNDSVLLGAAITLSAWSQQYPWQAPWLGTKVVLLLAYIGLGKLALRPEQPHAQRWCFSLAALGTVLWLVGVAITRSPTLLLFQ
ncbi:MAG: SirB2 family protein [Rhodoferax sp.]